jgi:hypothetical protein
MLGYCRHKLPIFLPILSIDNYRLKHDKKQSIADNIADIIAGLGSELYVESLPYRPGRFLLGTPFSQKLLA